MTGEARIAERVSPALRAAVVDASKTLELLNGMRYRANRMCKPEPCYLEACAKSRRELSTLSTYLRREAGLHYRSGKLLIMSLQSLRQTISDILESEQICGDTRDQLLAEASCACVIEFYASAHGPGLPHFSLGRSAHRIRPPSEE